MGLDGHRARQKWVGLGTVCIFLNTAAEVLKQDVDICTHLVKMVIKSILNVSSSKL